MRRRGGLKPTTGRVPRRLPAPAGASQLMLAHGPMARSVADLRLALGVLAGRDARDPRSVDAPLRGPGPRTAGLVSHLSGTPPATAAAIARAGDALRAAGWDVEEVEPPELDVLEAVWIALVAADVAAVLPAMRPFLSAPLLGHLERLMHLDPGLPPHRVHVERSRLARRWSSLFAEHAVLVGPTWTQPVWPVDADLDPATGVDLLRATTRFIFPGSALGLPVVTLPMGVDDGLPTTVQIYADLWREEAALDAAAALEAAPTLPLDPRGPRRAG
ncbi:MAG: amidase family protein [bacterium]